MIGDSKIMFTEERPENKGKKGMSKTTSSTYVDDTDAVLKRAKEKGAEVVMEPMDMFYGDGSAAFTDPFGQNWTVAVHVKDVSAEEIRRRGKEMCSKAA